MDVSPEQPQQPGLVAQALAELMNFMSNQSRVLVPQARAPPQGAQQPWHFQRIAVVY